MAIRLARLAVVGGILLSVVAAGCGSDSSKSDSVRASVEKIERENENNPALNRKVAALKLGSSIRSVRAKMGKTTRYQNVENAGFERVQYLTYGQWQLNFVDGRLHAIWKNVNGQLTPKRYEH